MVSAGKSRDLPGTIIIIEGTRKFLEGINLALKLIKKENVPLPAVDGWPPVDLCAGAKSPASTSEPSRHGLGVQVKWCSSKYLVLSRKTSSLPFVLFLFHKSFSHLAIVVSFHS